MFMFPVGRLHARKGNKNELNSNGLQLHSGDNILYCLILNHIGAKWGFPGKEYGQLTVLVS